MTKPLSYFQILSLIQTSNLTNDVDDNLSEITEMPLSKNVTVRKKKGSRAGPKKDKPHYKKIKSALKVLNQYPSHLARMQMIRIVMMTLLHH